MRNGWGDDGWRERSFDGRSFEGRGHDGPRGDGGYGGSQRRDDPRERQRFEGSRHEWDERDQRAHASEGRGWEEHRAIGDLPRRGETSRAWSMRGRQMRGEDDASVSYGEAPIVKVIEVVAQSPHSWEDAARRAVAEASRTVRDIKSIWIKDMNAVVSHDRIVEFRLVAKISFAIHSEDRMRRAHA